VILSVFSAFAVIIDTIGVVPVGSPFLLAGWALNPLYAGVTAFTAFTALSVLGGGSWAGFLGGSFLVGVGHTAVGCCIICKTASVKKYI
jgi:hypothetical protein